jgi:chromosome segregation protein
MTRLTALELVGFKSFADRTRFEFPEGLTAIVGPNGSGKSNVVDAIKWVLGEQSIRSLRGREMTDVIFSGSAGRRPLNAAETTLVFDNTSRDLPVDAEEVRITRRVYRSGEGEYLVNGEASRLRDIRELLSGTGVATEAYSVIEQGRVDALLVASGRDRRAVFEEAAGITRFRVRRGEALRRLERTDQSLARLGDILAEVAGRLGTVRQQAARARRYRELSARLRSLRLAVGATDLAGIDREVIAGRAAIASARESLAMFEAVEADSARRTAGIAADEQRIGSLLEATRADLADWRQRAAAAEAVARNLHDQRRALEGEAGRLAGRLRSAWSRRRAGGEALAAAAARITEAERELDAVVRAMAGLPSSDQEPDGLESARSLVAAARERGRRCDSAHHARLAELSRCNEELARAIAAVEPARREAEAAASEVAALDLERSTCEGALASAEERGRAAAEAVREIEREAEAVATAILSRMDEQSAWRARLDSTRARRDTLAELAVKREGVSPAVRDLLTNPFEGVVGLLGEAITAESGIAAIVDVVLGGRSTAIAVEDLESAQQRLEGAARPPGRICLVAARALGSPLPRPPADVDVLGRLDELVTVPASMRPAVTRLLGRVWVVETPDAARRLAPSAPPGTVLATRSGICLSSEGWVECGEPAVGGLVSRRSEMAALEARITHLEGLVTAASHEISALRERQTVLAEGVRAARQRQAAARDVLTTSRADLTRIEADARRQRSIVSDAETIVARLHAAIAERHAERARAAEQLEVSTTAAAEAAAHLASAEESLAERERCRGATLARLGELRVAAAEWKQQLAAAREQRGLLERETAAAQEDLRETRSASALLAGRSRGLDLDQLSAAQDAAIARWREQACATIATALFGERASLAEAARSAAMTADEARDSVTSLSQSIHRLELSLEQSLHARERILERIRDDYGVNLAAECRSPSDAEREGTDPVITEIAAHLAADPEGRARTDEEIDSLRRKLASMPPINQEAVAEAEELERRHAEIERQREDLVSAKRAVEDLVARIDEESRRLLGETIETVRGHFRELFERVFGGGQADIVLDPDVDLLDTSVEIVARPPGKEPRSISLLSGGEKTMTAVALLLAIFRSRPSPFCVLDEVDAALDEANVDRFVGTLRDFLGATQFIIVTHSKKTMAAATNLYGVTMEESGVSTRVAVRLERAAAARARAA